MPEPIINETNKESWKNKILRKNPWLEKYDCNCGLCERRPLELFNVFPDGSLLNEHLNSLDYKHLQSIKEEINGKRRLF